MRTSTMGTRGMESTVYPTTTVTDETEEGRDDAERATRDPYADETRGLASRLGGFASRLAGRGDR